MNYGQFSKKLQTISAITVTPFKQGTKEIDWQGVTDNIEYLVGNGMEIIVPCGNTSEFYSMTLDEAKEVTTRTIELVNKRAIVMPGIGYSLKTAIEMGKHAEQAGADCVMIHQPIQPHVTREGIIAYFKEIIETLNIPSVIYFKDHNISDDVLVELSTLDKMVGVKYAINDVPRFASLVREVPEDRNVTWICGTAEKWAPLFYNAGATGFTSGLVNVYPQKSREMLNALRTGNHETVWEVWKELLPFEDLRAKYSGGNNVVVIKEAMEQLSLNAGVTREPVAPLNPEDVQAVTDILNAWNLLQPAR